MLQHLWLIGAAALATNAAAHTPAPVSAPDARAKATFNQMTLDEKVRLLHGPMTGMLPPSRRPAGIAVGAGYIAGIERLGVPALVETDASLGVSNLNNLRPGDEATALPASISLAASWDPDLARQGGAMIGREARAKGFNVMLVGGANLVRDPRGGRTFEYLGEDPLLAGILVGAQIAGVQSNNIIGTIKHYALNDQETGRNVASVELDEAAMRESDLLAFQIGIERGQPGSVMCGYNRVGGVFACEHDFLLNQVLRRDWAFKGFVMSDWGAVHSSEAINKGLDQQSGEQLDGKKYFSQMMVQALAEGRVPQAAIDTSAMRILRTIYAHGLADHPVAPGGRIDINASGEVALKAARDGMVLLRNEGGMLPLPPTTVSIVVIGGNAEFGVLSGGGSSHVTPVGGFKKISPAGGGAAAAWVKRAYGGSPPIDGLRKAFPNSLVSYVDGKDPAVAAAAARVADVAIVIGEKFSTEAEDALDLSLGDGQDALIEAVVAANPRTVVVLETGSAVTMPWRDSVPAILAAWYPGQRGGDAIADVLSGAFNPAGRLPITFPASVEQLPNPILAGSDAPPADKGTRALYGLQAALKPFNILYPEGSDAGYRWFAKKGLQPLYAFGHGLSYTQFQYSDLVVTGGKGLTARFKVTNTGSRAGADVPQVYVMRQGKAKRLIGWAKPSLQPGQSQEVTVSADPRVLGDYDAKAGRWVIPGGVYRIEIGASSAEPLLKGVTRLSRQYRRP
ncbi:glycoside hydrolase family 3 protein [Caulobacter sp. Root342]|jgi:beta-glucosidase|uniref:beta-glucosidase n=1 Tax=Caulobacter sp. Root342 TaxID=1736519 RepID=UPI0006FD9BFB|nr:beta-glucosidase [Caulobacter sp. Root342]KQV54743.1 beta-glucosidase [Caulobacter sp. Root342]